MKNQQIIGTDNLRYGMNLQLFADGPASLDDPELQAQILGLFESPQAGAEPAAQQQQQPMPVSAPEGATAPASVADETAQHPSAQEPAPEESTQQSSTPADGQPVQTPGPDQQQLIGGKFKSVDDLLNAYQNIEAAFSRKAQEAAQFKAMAEQMQRQATMTPDPAPQAVQQQAQAAAQQAVQQDNPDTVDLLNDSEALAEILFSDPAKAVQMLREQITAEVKSNLVAPIEQKINPIIQQSEEQARREAWLDKVQAFSSQHPDIDQFSQDMGRIIMQNPVLRDLPNGLEIAYNAAKGQQYRPAQDPTSYLQDQEFVKNNILNNQQIRDQIIQQYLTELQQGGQPMSIGQASVSGSTPVGTPKRPTSLDEAGEMALSWFNKQG